MHKLILSSSSRAVATHTSAAFTTEGYSGIRVFTDVTDANGGSVTPVVQTLDQVSGNWVNIPGGAFAAISTNTTKLLTIRPGVAETANESVSDSPGSTIRISVPVGTAAVTFSMGMDLIR